TCPCGGQIVAARERGTLKTYNPWPKIGLGGTAAIVVIAGVIGFVFLDRYQQGSPPLDIWSAICRGLGIPSNTAPASEPQPQLRTPTRIAWTSATLSQIAAGDRN